MVEDKLHSEQFIKKSNKKEMIWWIRGMNDMKRVGDEHLKAKKYLP